MSDFGLAKLCFSLIVVMVLLGCNKSDVGILPSESQSIKTKSAVEKPQYANDIDRLDKLTGRINKACGGGYIVILGSNNPVMSGNGNVVSIDYGLFDRLTDDGAAVSIAEAVAEAKITPTPRVQTDVDHIRLTLERDEAVGRIIAAAGFDSEGFKEWLNVEKTGSFSPRMDIVPESTRISAFMRGYSVADISKGK